MKDDNDQFRDTFMLATFKEFIDNEVFGMRVMADERVPEDTIALVTSDGQVSMIRNVNWKEISVITEADLIPMSRKRLAVLSLQQKVAQVLLNTRLLKSYYLNDQGKYHFIWFWEATKNG